MATLLCCSRLTREFERVPTQARGENVYFHDYVYEYPTSALE